MVGRTREREACKFNLHIFTAKFNELSSEKRRNEHISTETLARNIGITRTTYFELRDGKRIPRADTLVMIAKYFGVSLDWLMGMENDIRDDESMCTSFSEARARKAVKRRQEREILREKIWWSYMIDKMTSEMIADKFNIAEITARNIIKSIEEEHRKALVRKHLALVRRELKKIEKGENNGKELL